MKQKLLIFIISIVTIVSVYLISQVFFNGYLPMGGSGATWARPVEDIEVSGEVKLIQEQMDGDIMDGNKMEELEGINHEDEKLNSDLMDLFLNNDLNKTITVNEEGIAIVTNPASILVVANKTRNLPMDYEPDDLVIPNVGFSFSENNPKKQLRLVAAEALEELFAAAEKDGIELKAVSGYRSYDRQEAIFSWNRSIKGEEIANQTSARPGQSEHQTGLAMDVSSASIDYALEESYGETIEGKWLAENAPKYGFILRYPKGKEHITGYDYEPWHLRFVGKEISLEITEQNLTLEEYLEKMVKDIELSSTKLRNKDN